MHQIDTLLSQGAGPGRPDFISWFKKKVMSNLPCPFEVGLAFQYYNALSSLNLQAQTDPSIYAELRHVANGCDLRVRSFTGYDVNGYRFHTTSYEQSRPNRKTTNSGVLTAATDGNEYHGRVQQIYELSFYGAPHLKPVILKCHWFDPNRTRRTPKIGLVEVRPDSVYPRADVYIVAQQAVQVYYMPYACQSKEELKGWEVVQKVAPHGKLPVPNDEDYNLINPNTYDGEFYQEEGLPGRFVIDLTGAIGMEVDNEMVDDDDDGDEVENLKDLEMLERLRLGNDNEDNIPPSDCLRYLDNIDSDDETYVPANPDTDPDYF